MTDAERIIQIEIKRRNPNKSLRLDDYPRRVLRSARMRLAGSELIEDGRVLLYNEERWTVEVSKPGGPITAWPKKI